MDKTSISGEIMRNALRLVKSKGDDALDYTNKMAERMEETGEEDELVFFWEKISKQVEILLYESE